ncbi:PaaI family thioesterase [Altererythrobacter sp.]|uniref:PaaI family thioesterase n=1 Tax=Altererythrobacter sp. TaxID=1872480 RepID=UPI003D002644
MSEKIIWWGGQLPEAETMTAVGTGSMSGHLGIEFTDVRPGSVTARMPVNERTQQPYGRLHGGASVALAETIASVAAAFTVDRSKSAVVGLEINANHVRPGFAGYVYATATPENLGRTTQIWSIRITDEAGKLVCISRFTAMVIPADRGSQQSG